MVVVTPHPREKIRAVSIHPGLAGLFQLPFASCLWLSHSDGCFLGSCALLGFWPGIGHNIGPSYAFCSG